jgi:hypothetical protein
MDAGGKMEFLSIREFSKAPKTALSPVAVVHRSSVSDKERSDAFERLMKFPRKKVPQGFDYKRNSWRQ